jgi:hypothetical protein
MAVITSITGLQNLTNLQEFRADFNGLQSVNLSGLTNLVTVDISDCDVPGTTTNSLTSVNLSGCTALTNLRLDDSEFSGGIPSLAGLTSLSTVNFGRVNSPNIIDMSGVVNLADADFFQNPNLTSLIIADTQPIFYLGVSNCGLSETAVDDILVVLSNNGVSNGEVNLSGGTNATPGAPGLAAKLVLEGNGWIVNVN